MLRIHGVVVVLVALFATPGCARAPESPPDLPSVRAARRILTPPFDDRARDLLDRIAESADRKGEFVPLLKALALGPLGESDGFDVGWTLWSAAGDAQFVAWLDGDDADHDAVMRLIPHFASSAGDWYCMGMGVEHASLHAALVRQLERRDAARREAVMDLLLTLDCQLGAVAEPLLRMLADEREDRREFARRSLLRCKGGMAWMRGSLAGAEDVLAASLGDPVRRGIVLELLASGSCRQSPKLATALEAELTHASDAERPTLEAALTQVRPWPVR